MTFEMTIGVSKEGEFSEMELISELEKLLKVHGWDYWITSKPIPDIDEGG